MKPQPKPKQLLDPDYKYWLVKEGTLLLKAFPVLNKHIPLSCYWGEAVNHHIRRHKKNDNHQVRVLAGIHAWFHTDKGIKWERDNLGSLTDFAEKEYARYLKEVENETR